MAESQKTAVLIGCSGKKLSERSASRDLYIGDLFLLSRQFVHACGSGIDDWRILSAKFGLLNPCQEIEPYDCTLSKMPKPERELWNVRVLRQLAELYAYSPCPVRLIVLAGENYRGWIGKGLSWAEVIVPLKGQGIGLQKAALKRMFDSANDDLGPVIAGRITPTQRVDRALERAKSNG